MLSWAWSPSVREVPGYLHGGGEKEPPPRPRPSRRGALVSSHLSMKLSAVQIYSVAGSKFPSLPAPGTTITVVSLGPWLALKDPLGVLATGQAPQLFLLV